MLLSPTSFCPLILTRTFRALHFRSRDRHINMHRYPALSYPDLYILQGGYSGFYEEYRIKCEPQQYVGMNDITHRNACEKEMTKFRRHHSKVGRASTYAGSTLDSSNKISKKHDNNPSVRRAASACPRLGENPIRKGPIIRRPSRDKRPTY